MSGPSVKRPMRPFPQRATSPAPDPEPRQGQTREDKPPEGRLRGAGLSGARALTRVLVALIEHFGIQDRHEDGEERHGGAWDDEASSHAARGWPHGTTRAAFGPTPFGDELARAMAAHADPHDAPRPPHEGHGAGTSRPPLASGASVAPEPFAAPDAAPPAASTRPVPQAKVQGAPATARPPPPSTPKDAATANIPAWQRPFIAAPGVRYMRTPDWVLRRPRDARPREATPIVPLAPSPADLKPSDATPPVGEPLPVSPPPPIDVASVSQAIAASFDAAAFHTAFIDEVDPLSIEDRVAFETRRGSPQRLRLSSGFAVDLPSPANDPLRRPASDAASTRQPFAIAVRPKAPKPAAPMEEPVAHTVAEDLAEALDGSLAEILAQEPAASAAAISARVTMPAMAASPARHRPTHVEWDYPAAELLAPARKLEGQALTADMLEQNARLLETTLEDFGVRGEIIHVRAGPVVTLYELEPAPGIKSSRVIGLADDIARSMSALSARVAVVPGRNAIGIELPNERRETVYFREMVESEAFNDSKHKLAIALGKTIGGEPVIADLAKMPHLLVAGTTGSGKSVAINTMILSLLYRLRPDECRLIMVDPKMLELSVYDGIPHLLTPVVTDPKKAVVALKWAVREMEDRYKKMSKLGVRNIDGFNARVTQAREAGETILMQVTTGFDRDTGKPTTEDQAMDLTSLPYIVVIVDEMADLMMVAGKDIEGAIQRLAQMARAAGIHLIMATQRPSVDVITGTIKANFPTRISFQVTSKIDSRTILGEQGAEQLLGQGDMLHMQGGGRIYRVHGPFVSDGEVEKVVAHLKAQGQPDYLDTVTEDLDAEPEDDDEAGEGAVFDKTAMGAGGEDDGNLYEQAVKVVLRDKKSSVSYVQRRLQVGYNKAASLIERMEKDGILGPASHTGKREILAHSRGRVISGVPMGDEAE